MGRIKLRYYYRGTISAVNANRPEKVPRHQKRSLLITLHILLTRPVFFSAKFLCEKLDYYRSKTINVIILHTLTDY
ncbi:hypothetical protein HanRHA438_Chr01g0023471 [Helianthus annuus]|nr:hypothetical protein HanIR_Chr01g0024721 [Helianthus annuus]KAJ0948107.1 hypothetical protein HanRHA438_Chr01g0023471 [Helianthus annuus]